MPHTFNTEWITKRVIPDRVLQYHTPPSILLLRMMMRPVREPLARGIRAFPATPRMLSRLLVKLLLSVPIHCIIRYDLTPWMRHIVIAADEGRISLVIEDYFIILILIIALRLALVQILPGDHMTLVVYILLAFHLDLGSYLVA